MAKKGNGIFLVYTDIDPKYDEEFNAWYNTEHLGDLLSLPGFLDAARYVAEKGGPKYLAVYELTSADALKTAEFQKWRANPSPWSRHISPTVIDTTSDGPLSGPDRSHRLPLCPNETASKPEMFLDLHAHNG